MANMMDYVEWRGDIPFSASPFNEVDALVLCQITYVRYTNIVSKDFERKAMTLSEVSKKLENSPEYKSLSDVGAMINRSTPELLKRIANTKRFGSLRVSGYDDVIDLEKEEQFCAITFSCDDGWNAIVYRGTDDTIVGWKEDFNLGYMKTVPAQKDALTYLEKAAKELKGTFKLCGHSKGGNLAIYSAAYCCDKTKKRLDAIYNNDGPGFDEAFFSSPEYLSIHNREHTFVPQLSIVGMLFSHAEGYVTVESDQKGIMQHDPFSWHVKALHFSELLDTTEQSKYIGKTINGWMNELPVEQRELFIETVFGILKNTDATTNTELSANMFDSLLKMGKAVTKIDPKTRDAVFKTVQILFKYAKDNFVDEFKPVGQK